MFLIHIHNLSIFAYHGIHDEERILGNHYKIDVDIEIDSPEHIKHIQQTVNYVTVYEVIKERMKKPTPLLETLAQDLALLIYEVDNKIRAISISIKKNHPPIANIQGEVGVTYRQTY